MIDSGERQTEALMTLLDDDGDDDDDDDDDLDDDYLWMVLAV